VVARARTGSGKTLAYLLPALNRILQGGSRAAWQALVLVPTRELCEQVREEAASLARHCGEDLTVTSLGGGGGANNGSNNNKAQQRTQLATAGALIVATPGRVAQLLSDGSLAPETLQQRLRTLVLDEADLLLSYGYEGDLQALAPRVPRACQCLLLSATTSADVDRLTALLLHNPVALDLLSAASIKKKGECSFLLAKKQEDASLWA
jgi:ATP-dependent RNA helicase DDX56/DBP9